MTKPKQVNYRIIKQTVPKSNGDDPHSVLFAAMKWHPELTQAAIGLAWRYRIKCDNDGHVVLGRCVKISELQKEFIPYDFVIVLNDEFWMEFSREQRLALIDHELCHAAAAEDKDGEHKEDDRGRKLWRMRKHDIEEFHDVVKRHGTYKHDLEVFAQAIRNSKAQPLLDSISIIKKQESKATSKPVN